MRVRMLVVSLFVLAIMGPPLWAGDAFWHGQDSSCLLDPEYHSEIHDLLLTAMPHGADGTFELVGRPFPPGQPPFSEKWMFRMPSGEMIPGVNSGGDRGLRIYDRCKAWNGFTFLVPLGPPRSMGPGKPPATAVLIDMRGNVVNTWAGPGMSKMLPGGHVVGGTQNGFEQFDWNGTLVHSWPGVNMHHDHQREGSACGYYAPYTYPKTLGGNALVLETSYPDLADTLHICSSRGLIDDKIRELSWDGQTVHFEWDAWKHFEATATCLGMGLEDEAAGNALDLGINVPRGRTLEDWTHGNDVNWLGWNKWYYQHHDERFHPCNIISDFRSLNTTIIIARYDHPYGKWFAKDIVWRLGPDYSTAGEDFQVGQIIAQHMAHMIPMYMPGEGNILIFDNGSGAGYGGLIGGLTDPDTGEKLGTFPNKFRDFSRVVEINPVTKQLVWEYKQPKPTCDKDGDGKTRGNERKFYSSVTSGAQRLMNGNTFIAEGDTGRVFEVTRKGEVVWEYVPKWWDPGPAKGTFMGLVTAGLYRAYRIPYWWVPKQYLKGWTGP